MQIGTYEASLRDRARELKRKFYPTTPVKKAVIYTDIPAFLHLTPSWKKEYTFFDSHVMLWRKHVEDTSLSPVRAYIVRRSAELGFTYQDMVRKSRYRNLAHARFLMMWEIKRLVKPHISYPQLGREFGGFDHTSCLHAVKTVDRWKAEGLAGVPLPD
jgi:hypothetical protein